MKTITVVALRHAKAAVGGYADDTLRSLTTEGVEQEKQLASKLKSSGISPTTLLSSPVTRAQETAEILSQAFDIPFATENCLGLNYNMDEIVKIVTALNEGETLFLVGHSPYLVELVNLLVGDEQIGHLPTSSAAIVTFNGSVVIGSGELKNLF